LVFHSSTQNVVFKTQKVTFVNARINYTAMGLIRMRNLHYVEQRMWLSRRRLILKSSMRKKRKRRQERDH